MTTPAATTGLMRNEKRGAAHPDRTIRNFRERRAAHHNKNGSNEPTDGFTINVKPHNKPYSSQLAIRDSRSASSSVAHTSAAARNAVSDVSQIHSNGIITALGNTAHSHAASAPAPTPSTRLPR